MTVEMSTTAESLSNQLQVARRVEHTKMMIDKYLVPIDNPVHPARLQFELGLCPLSEYALRTYGAYIPFSSGLFSSPGPLPSCL